MNKWAYLKTQQLMLLSTLLAIICVFYLQYMARMQPCPLCIAQRLCAFLFAFTCLIGLRSSTPKRGKCIASFQVFFSCAGLFFAIRQLWILTLPPEKVPACLPGLDVLIHFFPWQDVFYALFWGTGSCAEVSWVLLGLSIPAWAALYFVAMLLMSVVILFSL
ncbi:MAG: disulfide bond formation protein B [Legionellales bacterium]|nr:disulfide bond formation protein B [Legionellales bacterium]